jgi:1,4-dihydroxy-2-naphthoate octaprenyltransferase
VIRVVPVAVVVAVLVVPLVLRLNRIARNDEPVRLVPLLSGSARLHLLFGLLMSVGIVGDRLSQ